MFITNHNNEETNYSSKGRFFFIFAASRLRKGRNIDLTREYL